MSIHALWQRCLLPLAALALLVGCGEPEAVTTYQVPRAAPPAQPADIERARGELDHLLAAIVPQGEQAWFFKLVAPGDRIESLRKPFEALIASVEVSPAADKPTWKLPEGWREKPGDAMRAATIEAPAGGQTLPLTVSSLPLAGDWRGYVERNVNRWMNQLQQPPLPAAKIDELAREVSMQHGQATVIELVGVVDRTATPGMMPPGHPPAAAPPRAAGGADSSAPPAAGSFPKPAEFTYAPPAGWQPGRYGGMRTAAFNIAADGATAEVTAMAFPPVAQMTDPKAQADRWAGEIGLKLSGDQYDEVIKSLAIDGVDGQQFVLLGPDGPSPQGTLAAMVRRGDKVWFFKMKGDRSLVESQRDAFNEFLQSIKFTDK